MTDVSNNDGAQRPEKPKAGGLLKLAILALVAIGVVAVLIVMVPASFKPGEGPADLKSLAKGDLAKLTITTAPGPLPDLPFTGPDGHKVTLADFKGQVVVLNFWATWCGPCVTEMPTLAKLQGAYPVQGLKVVTVSVDRPDDQKDAAAKIAGLAPLAYYSDPDFALPYKLQPRIEGLPTTVLLDRKGVERARLSGGADWSSPDAQALIKALLKEK